MKKLTAIISLCAAMTGNSLAQTIETIDISGNNTSSNYISYDKTISLPSTKTVNVKMARYCYFSSTISGNGLLNLYAGGERCYLGTAKGAAWPNWTNYKGDIHVYAFKENSSSAGFYGVVLAHGGKSFSPENVEDDLKNGKVNKSMENNHVTLHKEATICCEANSAGAGFRIGELQTEEGSTIQGYMKTGRAAYFLVGCLNTDAVLAGTIAPSGYNEGTLVGLIKEGTGTYRITGNQNYLTGALRIMEGSVMVNNDRSEALTKKLRGGLGAKSNENEAISSWKDGMTEAGRQFNMLVAENEMKMETLQPSRGQFNYGAADNLVSFAKNNNMAVRGHCLVWHQQQPEWVSSDGKKNDKNWSRTEALNIMREHINKVMSHFKGKVTEWDVVNECLDDDQSIIRSNPEAYTLRQSVWQRAIGDDYIDSAFVYARRADPSALLYLNDYGIELQGKAKSVAFYNLVRHLQQRNIPLDGVGLQCHFSNGDVDSVKLENTIRRFGEAGMKCIITELDMGTPSTSTKDLEEQARNYRVVTDIVLNNENCPNLVIWGVKDNDSWRSGSNPLLYNSGLSKKPAWYAVRSALRHRSIVNEAASLRPERTNTLFLDENYYDLMGRRVTPPLRPGLYIQGGKKIYWK